MFRWIRGCVSSGLRIGGRGRDWDSGLKAEGQGRVGP